MKKILFNDKYGLTQAVLEDRKTQTRRIIKTSDAFERVNPDFDWDDEDIKNWENSFTLTVQNMSEEEKKNCFDYLLAHPKYKVGEVVAVAQSYKDVDAFYSAAFSRKHSVHGMTIDTLDCVSHEDIKKWFDIREQFVKKASWKNKLFVKAELMPHQICITDVKIERLQDISENDAIAEGITYAGLTHEDYGEPMFIIDGCKQTFGSSRDAYAWLINKISSKRTWQSNPYVFVYDFELVK